MKQNAEHCEHPKLIEHTMGQYVEREGGGGERERERDRQREIERERYCRHPRDQDMLPLGFGR